jgi:hypothetical protein
MITIDKTKDIEVIEVAIGKKTYKIPLAKYLPYKAIKKLRSKEENNLDSIIEILSDFIPIDILENLTMQQITQILEAWSDASQDNEDNTDVGK